MTRPNSNSQKVRELAEQKIRDILSRASGEENDSFDDEVDWLFKYNERDSYRIARAMENDFYWDVDGSMLDYFDEITGVISNAVAQAEREWFSAGPLFPDHEVVKVGDSVEFDDWGKTVKGEIVRVNDQGYATVYCPELGHVKEGLGTHGRILPVEKLRKTLKGETDEG